MSSELLILAPVVCVVLALGALYYFTRTLSVQRIVSSSRET